MPHNLTKITNCAADVYTSGLNVPKHNSPYGPFNPSLTPKCVPYNPPFAWLCGPFIPSYVGLLTHFCDLYRQGVTLTRAPTFWGAGGRQTNSQQTPPPTRKATATAGHSDSNKSQRTQHNPNPRRWDNTKAAQNAVFMHCHNSGNKLPLNRPLWLPENRHFLYLNIH